MTDINVAVYWVDNVVSNKTNYSDPFHMNTNELQNYLSLVEKLYETAGINVRLTIGQAIGWDPSDEEFKSFLWTTEKLLKENHSMDNKPGILILVQEHHESTEILGEMYDIKKRSGAACFLRSISANQGVKLEFPQVAAHEIGHMLNLNDHVPSDHSTTNPYTCIMEKERAGKKPETSWSWAKVEAQSKSEPYFHSPDPSIVNVLFPLCYEARLWLNNPGAPSNIIPGGSKYHHPLQDGSVYLDKSNSR